MQREFTELVESEEFREMVKEDRSIEVLIKGIRMGKNTRTLVRHLYR